MKVLLLFVMLFAFQIPALAQTMPPDEPQSVLTPDAIGAIKAILANPTEAAAFSARTELMRVTVMHNSSNEKLYKFEGKRLQSGGYRGLNIREIRGIVGDAGGFIYEPTLIP